MRAILRDQDVQRQNVLREFIGVSECVELCCSGMRMTHILYCIYCRLEALKVIKQHNYIIVLIIYPSDFNPVSHSDISSSSACSWRNNFNHFRHKARPEVSNVKRPVCGSWFNFFVLLKSSCYDLFNIYLLLFFLTKKEIISSTVFLRKSSHLASEVSVIVLSESVVYEQSLFIFAVRS